MKAIIILLLSVSAVAQVSSGGTHAESPAPRLAEATANSVTRRGPTATATASQSGPLERTPQIAMVASAAFDTGTTIHNLRNGCSENNPLLGSHPSTAKVVAFEAGWTAGELVIAHFLHRHHPKIASLLVGESIIEHGVAGGLNTTQKCF